MCLAAAESVDHLLCPIVVERYPRLVWLPWASPELSSSIVWVLEDESGSTKREVYVEVVFLGYDLDNLERNEWVLLRG